MSYNISTWKTKRIDNLVIPFSALYDENIRKDWLPQKPEIESDGFNPRQLTINCGCEQTIKGYAGDEQPIAAIHVTEFEMTGEGSGTFWHEVLRPALEKSTGYLEVARIWEGEYIDKCVVKNGVITETEVEL